MMPRGNHDLRYQPLYTLADVSRYARVPLATLKDWCADGNAALVAPPRRGIVAPFSFINLIEAHVLVALRRTHRVPMQRVRKAVRWLRRRFDTAHPLAERNLETDGYDVFVRELGIPVAASQGGQMTFPSIMDMYLKRVERDERGPIRFFPFTYDHCPKTVVMDPRVDFGRPVIEGTRVETVMIFERYSGGESLSEVAGDYDLGVPAVEEALRCEIERRAA